MLNLVTGKCRHWYVIAVVCLGIFGCVWVLSGLVGCSGSDNSSTAPADNGSEAVSTTSQSDDFTGTPTTIQELQKTPDFKRTQQTSLQIHKGMAFTEVAALCGEGTWTDNSDGEMKLEGTAGYYTWVDKDGKWMILAGFDGNTPDSKATGEVFVRPVDEHIYDGLRYC